jgi:hypothetical protein
LSLLPPDAGVGAPAPAREACDHAGRRLSEGGQFEGPVDRLRAHRAGAEALGLASVVRDQDGQLALRLEAALNEVVATSAVDRVVVDVDLALDAAADETRPSSGTA